MISRQQCTLPPDITEGAVKDSFDDGRSTLSENQEVQLQKTYEVRRSRSSTWDFLNSLRANQWAVTSFNPKARLACADLYSDCGNTHHLAFTLPVESNSSRF